MKSIDLNDPKLWKNIDWDEPKVPELLKKTDALIEQQIRGKRLKDIRGENWKNNHSKAMTDLSQDPVWQAAHKAGAKKKEFNENYKQQRAERNRSQVNDPIYQQNLNEGIARRDANPEVQKARLKGAEERLMRKGFIVSPAGIHLRQNESADANNITVITLQKRIKNNKTEYYYISKEEYSKLTGKEL